MLLIMKFIPTSKLSFSFDVQKNISFDAFPLKRLSLNGNVLIEISQKLKFNSILITFLSINNLIEIKLKSIQMIKKFFNSRQKF